MIVLILQVPDYQLDESTQFSFMLPKISYYDTFLKKINKKKIIIF